MPKLLQAAFSQTARSLCLAWCSVAVLACGGEGKVQSLTLPGAVQAHPVRVLPPSAFPELPATVRQELESRHCMIPQAEFETNGKTNVIRGKFFASNSLDWAILCSHNGTSSILVFREGGEVPPAEFGSSEDTLYSQAVSGNRFAYSRQIRVFAPKDFRAYQRQGMADPHLPPLHHDAVDDGFNGKGDQVYYFRGTGFLVIGMGD
jgi:hypothetical protein